MDLARRRDHIGVVRGGTLRVRVRRHHLSGPVATVPPRMSPGYCCRRRAAPGGPEASTRHTEWCKEARAHELLPIHAGGALEHHRGDRVVLIRVG
eukprot:5242799-Prymnesium_polylepis.2